MGICQLDDSSAYCGRGGYLRWIRPPPAGPQPHARPRGAPQSRRWHWIAFRASDIAPTSQAALAA
eukprot:1647060-Pyramimonas_sp.AAC.1